MAAAGSGDPGAHVGTIAGKAPALLAVLERHDVARFDPAYKPSRPGDLFGAVRQLRDIGVLGGSSCGPPAPGMHAYIGVGTIGVGGVLDGSAVTDAVEQAGNDNIAKLAKTGADERHLFIWADRSDHATEGTLALGRLPTKPPSLPVGIDVVWVAAWAPRVAYHCYASTLWRATPASGWQTLVPPDVLGYVAQVTGDGSALRAEDAATDAVRSGLIAYGVERRRQLRLPNS